MQCLVSSDTKLVVNSLRHQQSVKIVMDQQTQVRV
jgi:hypothetical protein